MANYAVTFARPARRELERLDAAIVNQVFPRIEALAENPRPRGCHKLRRERNLWRIRVGDYRFIYAVDDRELIVDVIAVRHRSKAYE